MKEEKDWNVLVLALNGRLDSTTSTEFEKRIVGAIEGKERHIVIDMSGIDYISSAGLRAVLIGAKQMSAGYGKLALCGLSEKIADVFHMSGFDKILTIVPTRDEAVSAVSG